MIRYGLQVLLMLTPWGFRRRVLKSCFGFEIAASARIGFSIVVPGSLSLAEGSSIGHLNLIRGMDRLELGRRALIGHLNWIYGIPDGQISSREGRSSLTLAEGAGITRRHLIDCSAPVQLGRFSLIAGYGTQVLTHSVDLGNTRLRARPISIGDYALLGSRTIVLGSSVLPGYSVLGAGSTLRDRFDEEYSVYSGVPATKVGERDPSDGFFNRTEPQFY